MLFVRLYMCIVTISERAHTPFFGGDEMIPFLVVQRHRCVMWKTMSFRKLGKQFSVEVSKGQSLH